MTKLTLTEYYAARLKYYQSGTTERLGQHFYNKYDVLGPKLFPELFYERNDDKAEKLIIEHYVEK